MSKDQDQLNNGATGSGTDSDYSVDQILAEYGVKDPKKKPTDPLGHSLPWPESKKQKKPKVNVVRFPGPEPEPEEPEEEPEPEPEEPPKKSKAYVGQRLDENLVNFPSEDTSPLQLGLDHLIKKADAYAEQMFRDEGVEVSEETTRFERLIPGVDEEEEEAPFRERKPRREAAPPPDLAPHDLAGRYARGLGLLRLRSVLVFLLCIPLILLTLAPLFRLPLPNTLVSSFELQVYISGGLLAVAMILGADVLARGVIQFFVLRPGADTLTAVSCGLCLADALTQLKYLPERTTLPYCAAAALSLFFAMWGTYTKKQALRLTCRTAATASTPYLVTLEEDIWNGKDAYAKWSAPLHGFGSQVQEADGTQRAYRIAAPLLLIACVCFSLIASVGKDLPMNLLWCLSATVTASASFSGLIIFGRPFRVLARRLTASGAALAGWAGIAQAGSSILLNDHDLFPPGTVSLNGIKVFGDFPVEKVVALTATLIRDSGSGLDKIFHDLLRTQGATYRRTADFQRHEGGGLTANVRGELVCVGSASFMALMEVSLPQGINVRNAVFCAIDGDLAGIFALNYVLHPTIAPALSALINAKISPVLATRDFNLIPAMLRQKFKLPVEKMDFPNVERRSQLSDPSRLHGDIIAAVLCREGVLPFSEAVVGARRLRTAVRAATAITLLGSVIGVLMAFYLTYLSNFAALSPDHLLVFLAAWLVPTYLISGWVNRY